MKKIVLLTLTHGFAIALTSIVTFTITNNIAVMRYSKLEQNSLDLFDNYIKTVSKNERAIIEKIPSYSDYKTKTTEKELRKFLYKYHLKVAQKYGVYIKKDSQIQSLVSKNKLVEVKQNNYIYFYGVKKEYRFLTPKAASCLELVASTFQENLKAQKAPHTVKLAVSSLLRPRDYQSKLQTKNKNAINESTHSYGVSFDLFFEDYYLVTKLHEDEKANPFITAIRSKLGFLIGDATRRQLHTVLSQTLTQLQNEGLIYCIYERRQKVYHITFTEKFLKEY